MSSCFIICWPSHMSHVFESTKQQNSKMPHVVFLPLTSQFNHETYGTLYIFFFTSRRSSISHLIYFPLTIFSSGPSSCCRFSSSPCYAAQRINCGLKNSQMRLGGIVEANESELQGERSESLDSLQKLFHPADAASQAGSSAALAHRAGSWFKRRHPQFSTCGQ